MFNSYFYSRDDAPDDYSGKEENYVQPDVSKADLILPKALCFEDNTLPYICKTCQWCVDKQAKNISYPFFLYCGEIMRNYEE